MQAESHQHEQNDHGQAPAAPEVLLLEDDPVFAGALARAVHALDATWQVRHHTRVVDGLRSLDQCGPRLRLALVDMNLPDGTGLEMIRALRERHPQVPALVVSSLASEEAVLSAIGEGARGYLHKGEPVQALASAIGQVLQGNYPISPSLARYLFKQVRPDGAAPEAAPADEGPRAQLTAKESETLRLIALGHSYAETAQHMGVSLSTVQSHIRNLYRKLEVRSQMQAVGKARAQGLL